MSFPLQQGGGGLDRPPKLRRTWVSSAAELPTLSTFSNHANEAPDSRLERGSPSQRLPYLSTAQISYAKDTQEAVFDNPFSCFPLSPRAPKSPGKSSSASHSPRDPPPNTDFQELSAVLRRIPSSNRVFGGPIVASPSVSNRPDSTQNSGWTAAFRPKSRGRSRTNSITGPDAEGVPADFNSRRLNEGRASTSSRRPRTADGAIGSLAISITDRSHVTAIDLDPAWSCSDSEHSHPSRRSSVSSSVAAPVGILDQRNPQRDSVGSFSQPIGPEHQAEAEFEGEEWLANPDDSLERREQGYGHRRSWSTTSQGGNQGLSAMSNSFPSQKGMPIISSTTSVKSMRAGDETFRPVVISRSVTSDSSLNASDSESYTQISSPGTIKHRKKRRPQTTHGPGGVASTPKSPKTGRKFLSFLKEKTTSSTGPSPASAMPSPIFPTSPTTGSIRRNDYPEVLIRPSTSQGIQATVNATSIAGPRSSVSSSETAAGLTAESVSGSSMTSPSSAPLTSQSSLSIPPTQRVSGHSVQKPGAFPRPTSVRSNSACSEQFGPTRLSESQTRSSDSANSKRSLPRSFRRGSTPSEGHQQHGAYDDNKQVRKAVAAADQAYAAMFPYESRSRTTSDAHESSPTHIQSFQNRSGSGNQYQIKNNMPSLSRASSMGQSGYHNKNFNNNYPLRSAYGGLRDVLPPPKLPTASLGRSSTAGMHPGHHHSLALDPALDLSRQPHTLDGSRVPDKLREVPRSGTSSSKKRGLAGRLSSWLENI